jgi:hypothetical protein
MSRAPLILAAIIMPSCALVVGLSVFALTMSSKRPAFHEWDVAEAYSCAFVTGQYATMDALPAVFPGGRKLPSITETNCAKFKEIAAKHGFHQGASAAAPPRT